METAEKIIETAHQRVPGLFLTGNFLKGVSIINCLDSAKDTARRVHALLEKKSEFDARNESTSYMAQN